MGHFASFSLNAEIWEELFHILEELFQILEELFHNFGELLTNWVLAIMKDLVNFAQFWVILLHLD